MDMVICQGFLSKNDSRLTRLVRVKICRDIASSCKFNISFPSICRISGPLSHFESPVQMLDETENLKSFS